MRLHLPRLATAATILAPNDHLILSQCCERKEAGEGTREQWYPIKSLVPRSVVIRSEKFDQSRKECRKMFAEM
jgi:hypothetical protein